ncbi:adenylosuccinate lyase [Microbacteriaceae bacterium VKM Ac-2855]|nr:adenylosuccinate lyase [Microbacteriaceae bacterium VKM Ac-2855]
MLSPVSVADDRLASDQRFLDALVTAELGLLRAWAELGALPRATVDEIAQAWNLRELDGRATLADLDPGVLAAAAVASGNPVVPLALTLKERAPMALREWVHRGATSQDIIDTAFMLVARDVVDAILAALTAAEQNLSAFAAEHRDTVAAARTLTQHAVPTTVGMRATGWLMGIRRAIGRLQQLTFPAQLGGAAGTRASFYALAGADAERLPSRFAGVLGLDYGEVAWHTSRWPVTELADALTQVTDALGKLAGDVATLSRTEIGEISVGSGGGSSAMPQKSNPVEAVLVRSASLRAPYLAATLHSCAALAADERPAGAWHAEWPVLRELLRLTLGASATTARLTASLRVDGAAVARNLALSGGLILAERLSIVLTPIIGTQRVAELIAAARGGADLGALLRELPGPSLDPDVLLDPAGYLGDSIATTDRLTRRRDSGSEGS